MRLRCLCALLALGASAAVLGSVRSAAADSASSPCAPPSFGPGAGEGLNDPKTIPPAVGTLRLGMLFVDFSDAPGSPDPASIRDAWAAQLSDRYRTVSYGRLQIVVEPLLRWIRLPRTLADYDAARFEGAVQDALAAADSQFDFSKVDALVLVTATDGPFRLASTILEHDPLRLDGKEMYAWAWISVTPQLGERARVLIHETGHLLGLPDLYVIRISSSYHHWDVMTAAPAGGGMFGWHRWKLGWLEPAQVACLSRRGSLTTTLTPIEAPGGRKIAVARFPRSAVVAEVRQPLADDAGICKSGVLVYRVGLSSQLLPQPITVAQPRGDDPRRRAACGPAYNAPLSLGRGQQAAIGVGGVQVRVLQRFAGGSYRIRFTRKR